MTWETTHLALESGLIFIFLPKSRREFYSNHKKEWFIVSLLAAAPDLDAFLMIHRSFSHSLVMVALYAIIIIPLIQYLDSRKKVFQEHAVLKDALVLFPWFWALHIILDFGFGPMQLFYPFSHAFFDVEFYLLVSLKPVGPIPFLPYGIAISFDMLTENAGLKSFVINMSYEERLSLFGTSKIRFAISAFPVHAFIFIGWCFWLSRDYLGKLRLLVSEKLSGNAFSKPEIRGAFAKAVKALKILGWLWLIGVSSILASNSIPATRVETGYAYWGIAVLSEQFTPMQFLEVNFPEKTTPKVVISLPSTTENISIGLYISTDFNTVVNATEVTSFIQNWNDSYTSVSFRDNYTSVLKAQEWFSALSLISLKRNASIIEITITSSTDYLLIGIVLVDWANNFSFVKTGEIKITSGFDQSEEKSFFLVLGVINLLIPILGSVILGLYGFVRKEGEK